MPEYFQNKAHLVLDWVSVNFAARDGAFLMVGVLLGYSFRAFISARRRARARRSRHDFHE